MVTNTAICVRESVGSISYRAGNELSANDAFAVRQRMVLEGFKWDPQVGDTTTIAPFAIILSAATWRELSILAENLTSELMAVEAELVGRPDLHQRLGLPWRLRRVLRRADAISLTPAATRVRRFDFHLTDQGWRISEANNDVPGGFSEASKLPATVARYYPGTRPAGNPAAAWADAICAAAVGPHVGLLSATGFMEDQQIMAYLASLLARRGFTPHWIGLRELMWKDKSAYLRSHTKCDPLGAVVRFYQAEWLAACSRRHGWSRLFVDGNTPVANPAASVLAESKRLPLAWDELKAVLPTWRALLPETRDPRDAPWTRDESWLVKSAFCNTGDTVAIRQLLTHNEWHCVWRDVRRRPGHWVAQRRFSPIALETPAGKVYPCFGVYTVDGRVCGVYGRISSKPLIDFAAVDVAVLIEEPRHEL
jgi:glutathionylspermidine synthase